MGHGDVCITVCRLPACRDQLRAEINDVGIACQSRSCAWHGFGGCVSRTSTSALHEIARTSSLWTRCFLPCINSSPSYLLAQITARDNSHSVLESPRNSPLSRYRSLLCPVAYLPPSFACAFSSHQHRPCAPLTVIMSSEAVNGGVTEPGKFIPGQLAPVCTYLRAHWSCARTRLASPLPLCFELARTRP